MCPVEPAPVWTSSIMNADSFYEIIIAISIVTINKLFYNNSIIPLSRFVEDHGKIQAMCDYHL